MIASRKIQEKHPKIALRKRPADEVATAEGMHVLKLGKDDQQTQVTQGPTLTNRLSNTFANIDSLSEGTGRKIRW